MIPKNKPPALYKPEVYYLKKMRLSEINIFLIQVVLYIIGHTFLK